MRGLGIPGRWDGKGERTAWRVVMWAAWVFSYRGGRRGGCVGRVFLLDGAGIYMLMNRLTEMGLLLVRRAWLVGIK